jgi:hypothetical protein
VRQDWPDPGVVAVHRTGSTGPLTVNFSIGGTAGGDRLRRPGGHFDHDSRW